MLLVTVTAFTLIAFAANSLLCRLALGGHLIDPISFTTLRLASGALILLPLSRMTRKSTIHRPPKTIIPSALALFGYAIAFSLAYVSLNTGIGALILFGSVQITMIAAALMSGERLRPMQWLGSLLALGGLIYLVSPGITAPSLWGAVLMCVAGVSWGVYSVRGRNAPAPVSMTAQNFLWAAPLAILVSALTLGNVEWQADGVAIAIVAGAIASAPAYVLWYKALGGLTTTQASIVQLLVPMIAAFGGVAVLDERVTTRLVIASAIILGGVMLAVLRRRRVTPSSTGPV